MAKKVDLNKINTYSGNRVSYDKQIWYRGLSYLDPKNNAVDDHKDLDDRILEPFEGLRTTVMKDETCNNETTRYIYKRDENGDLGWSMETLTIEGDDLN